MYRTYRNTTTLTKRLISIEDIQLELAKISFNNPIPLVNDIASRNAYVANVTKNVLIAVKVATGDTTVESGGALYFYHKVNDEFIKIAEYDEADGPLFDRVVNGPTSTATEIDSMVTESHEHRELSTLNTIRVSGGHYSFNGVSLTEGVFWKKLQW